jgi:hypothetical protein
MDDVEVVARVAFALLAPVQSTLWDLLHDDVPATMYCTVHLDGMMTTTPTNGSRHLCSKVPTRELLSCTWSIELVSTTRAHATFSISKSYLSNSHHLYCRCIPRQRSVVSLTISCKLCSSLC